jgi:hypothetical protein
MMGYGDPSTSFAATIGRSEYDLLAKVKPREELCVESPSWKAVVPAWNAK